MPDNATAAPPASASAGVDTLKSAAASARSAADNWSPPESAGDRAGASDSHGWSDAPPPPSPGSNPSAYADQLSQARARDKGAGRDSAGRFEARSASPDSASSTNSTNSTGTPAPGAEPPNGLVWKRSDDWKRVNAERDSLRAQLAALQGRPTPSTSAPAPNSPAPTTDPFTHPDVIKLKKERDEYFDVVKLVRAEQDPDFRARFDGERDSILNLVKQKAGGARDEVVEVMSLPPGKARDRALSEVTKDFGDSARAEIAAANARLIALDVNRRIELETRARTWEQRSAAQAHQSDARRTAREAQLKGAFDKTVRAWQDPESGMPFVLPARDARDNAQAQAIFDHAESILFGNSPHYTEDSLATDALKAATFDAVIQRTNYILDEFARLKDAYDRVAGVSPGADAPARAHVDAPSGGAAAAVMAQARNGGGRAPADHAIPVLQGLGDYTRDLAAARRADEVRKHQGR